jgi:hypothetical protein
VPQLPPTETNFLPKRFPLVLFLRAQISPQKFAPIGQPDRNYNMPALFITDPSKWPRADTFANVKEWRHSDVKEIAYSHMYKLFDKIVQIGGLDQ